MSAYALAHLREIDLQLDVLECLERIQATLDSFSGRFIVHGGTVDVREGTSPGNLVVIKFPSLAEARSWYDSAAYQAILLLRMRHPTKVVRATCGPIGRDSHAKCVLSVGAQA